VAIFFFVFNRLEPASHDVDARIKIRAFTRTLELKAFTMTSKWKAFTMIKTESMQHEELAA
jgi:hypothetical protein